MVQRISKFYPKALRLSKTALGETASGKTVNLLSNDVSRFDLVSIFIHYMWVAPICVIIITYFLYTEAGYAGLVGIGTVLLVVSLQGYIGKYAAIFRKQTAVKTDERVRLMDEIIAGVQVIKMYAWEKPFSKLIKLARKKELKVVMKSSYVRALYMTFNLFTTKVALFCTLWIMVLTDQKITAAKVFVFMSYFNILAQSVCMMFVRGISEMAELFVTIKRLEGFMMNEEYSSTEPSVKDNNFNNGSKYAISLKNLTVKYSCGSSENALEKVSLDVLSGKLLGVIGPVGSGKSSLLHTILGELEMVNGSIQVNGSISYAAQEPWVFASTVRQNILFGSEYDKTKYNQVVHACALEKDFKQFPNGDLSIVGDRGASLSGGQKARINLARAIYRDADIYLLDDPLSAVDIHVSKHLYDLCIDGYLANKTRILVTHQVHHLKNANNIVILNNGLVETFGTFQILSQGDNIYAKLLTTEPEQRDEEKQKELETRTSILSVASMVSVTSELSLPEAILSELTNSQEKEEEDDANMNIKELQEKSSKGKVHGSLFFKYLFAGGSCFFAIIVMALYILAQASASGIDYVVSFFVDVVEHRNVTELVNSSEIASKVYNRWTTESSLFLYGYLVLTLFVVALLRSVLFYKLAMSSSQKLHDRTFYNVIMTTMRFFDTNPSGRILNRFSKDIGSVDELLPKVILDSGQILLMMVGSLILIAFVNPYFLLIVGIIGFFGLLLRHVYIKMSKNIKRLEGIMRSPVFTHLNATLQGITTIRAYHAQSVLKNEFDKHQDYHTSAWFMYIAASSAFGFYMDVLCWIFIAVVTFSFLTFGEQIGLTAGEVGLCITQSIALTGIVQWGIRQSAEVANQLMSVERVLEYESLPKEVQSANPKSPSSSWPNKGEIVFNDVSLKYHENGVLVLKNLNFTIKPTEKVGIVGRTGAGKSSLISALFRLANVEGQVVIDDIDTSDLALETLRSKISIIPQDPVLFSGTLRYNLDPFEEYSDEVLYKAIEDVELKDPANIINRLENRVMDRGANYSVGQRQLICLARAIVRNNRILMLDEATANVDPQTDALIQKTIRKQFSNCTVLTIAHRLNTIMDSDKVLVMDFGTMVEFDHPHNLLQNPNGIFYQMVMESGETSSEQLSKVATESYK